MLITNLVCLIFLIPISIEVLTLMHFLQFLLHVSRTISSPCLWYFSGVEAGKKAAGEVLALQKRVLAVLNEARHVAIILIPVYLFVYNFPRNPYSCFDNYHLEKIVHMQDFWT